MVNPPRYRPCGGCGGDGCPACEGAGVFLVSGEPPALSAPIPLYRGVPRAPAPVATGKLYQLAVCRDGTARADDGFTYPRWALCLSPDGKGPRSRYRNGGPVALLRTSAMRTSPDWMARAVAFVRAHGGVSEVAAPVVAAWYRSHRDGNFPGSLDV